MDSKWIGNSYTALKQRKLLFPVASVIIVIALAFLIGPKITGFATYSNNLDECETNLETCNSNVATLTTQKTTAENELAATQNTLAEKENELKQINADYQAQIESLNKKYDDAVETFNKVTANAGRNICCKMRYDNGAINSFDIDDSKIVCTTDGAFSIDC